MPNTFPGGRATPFIFEPTEWRKYSQNGEDGVLADLLQLIGETNRYFVEFGCDDGRERNTRLLQEQGWTGLLMSIDEHPSSFKIQREHVTAENVNDLFAKYNVPPEFDLLSIDIDGNDYWVWKALLPAYRPRIVIIEYNGLLGPDAKKTIRYDSNFAWNGSDYFGASLRALRDLGQAKGYHLLYCESKGVNAFFVEDHALPEQVNVPTLEEVFRPFHRTYPPDDREWTVFSNDCASEAHSQTI